jgi:hypothetical protein
MQAEKGNGYTSSSEESSGYDSSSTEELSPSPTQIRRIKRRVNKFRKGVKNLRVLTKHVGRTIKLLHPNADIPEYSPESFASDYSSESTNSSSSRSSGSSSSSSSSSSHGSSPRRPERRLVFKKSRTDLLRGDERGAKSTGKTMLDNNLTSWWSRYKKKFTDRELEELYDEFNFRKGQKMTRELQEKIKEFKLRRK